MTEPSLPVPVTKHPHWRVNMRPEGYNPELLPSLSACFDLVQSTKLSLRGWDYPHLSKRSGERTTGNNWVASWSSFGNHFEYWRLYQSGQFLHLSAVREALAAEWSAQLRQAAQTHASHRRDFAWGSVRGYLSLLNALYTVTEIFEFAARVAQRGVYAGIVAISIELRRIKGFVLTPELDRDWSDIRQASEENIGHTWSVESRDLVAASSEASLKASVWLFERFGWMNPSINVIRRDQEKFLAGRA